MSVSSVIQRVEAQTGTAVQLFAGDALEITDIEGGQVCDIAIFSAADVRECFSAGRTLDYNETMFLTTGAALYSNRSTPLMRIERDDVGRHDFLLTPCSSRMFEILRGEPDHPSCLANLAGALQKHSLDQDDIHATMNIFMNVSVDAAGRIAVLPPRSKAGDRIVLRAMENVLVGVAACSSEHSNGGVCKPVGFRVLPY